MFDVLGVLGSPAFIITVYLMAAITRSLAMRFASMDYSAAENTLQVAVWMIVVGFCLLPFCLDKIPSIWLQKETLLTQDVLLVLFVGLFKGFFFYFVYTFMYKVIKKSFTTYIYAGPLSVGFVAAFNAFVLGELLTTVQWVAVCILFFVSLIYMIFGHMRHFTWFEIMCLVLSVCSTVVFNGIDFVVISKTNWYVQFLLFPWGILLAMLLTKPKLIFNYPVFLKGTGLLYGLVFAVTDIFILLPRVTVLPVSIVHLLALAVIPPYMYIASLYFKEGIPYKQFMFGLIAAACAGVVALY